MPSVSVPPAEAAYLAELLARLRAELGDALVGVYPTGSLALDGYVPGRSDLDVLAVVDPVPAAPVLRRVAGRLSHDVLPCPATGLEFVAYPRDVVAAGGTDAGYVLDLNTGRELPPKVDLETAGGPRFWYVIDRAVTRQAGRAFAGPPPAALFRAVPFGELLPVVVESVRAHVDDLAGHGDNAVLNGCRALRFGAQRRWYAKPDAARWALGAAPEYAPLIESALASHAAGRASRRAPDPRGAREFLRYVLDRLTRG